MAAGPSIPALKITLETSLALRALSLLGVALPANADKTISARTLQASQEYTLASQQEDSWLRGFLAQGAWQFTRRQLKIRAVARAVQLLTPSFNPPVPLPWIWQTRNPILLRVSSVRATEDDSAVAWQFNGTENSLYLAEPEVLVACHIALAFMDLPEDAKECATYGFAAHLALPITGSSSLHDTLKREHEIKSIQLRRLRLADEPLRVSLQPGAYLRAFNGAN